MDTDLAIVIGIATGGLAFLSLVSAFSESRAPRAALMLGIVSVGLVVYALKRSPTGYDLEGVAHAFLRVIAGVFN